MQHAEAHERLADLALEPRAFLAFDRDRSPEAGELRAHVAGCATCAADAEGWRGTHVAVLEVLGYAPVQGSVAPFDDQPIALPPGLRAAVAAIPGQERTAQLGAAPGVTVPLVPLVPPVAPVRRGASSSRARWWLGLAAALVVAIAGAGAVAIDRAHQADVARAESAELVRLVRSTEQILADPGHTSITLASASGTASGLVAWSDTDSVVIATGLNPPDAGLAYRCWVEKS
ncbi:MAG: hypothetical protein QOJ47_2314, partial [Gaiellales bacterium]|nr:hypothetical protein [Gaiellales bacterium]